MKPRSRTGLFFRLTLRGVVSLFVVCVLPLSLKALGSGSFTPHQTTPSFGGGQSTAVALGDLDGDGDLDAVVANWNNQAETVWVNDGAGNFSAHPTTPAFGTTSSFDIALGDVDGDDDLDALVVDGGGVGTTVWVNDGTGSFSPHPTTPAFGGRATRPPFFEYLASGVALGDLDGDDDLDAVVTNAAQEETVWVNDGTGSFSPHATTPTFGGLQDNNAVDVALGDLDADGDLDAVVANRSDKHGGLPETVWLNDGTGSFSAHPTTPQFGAGSSIDLELGDLDGDGDLDVVVANEGDGAETVWVNDGEGSFSPHPTTPAFGSGNSRTVVLGDLDGDGDLDAVVANDSAQAETVWVNDATGSFTSHPTTPAFGAANSFDVALGDLDGDDDLDVVVANISDEAETVWVNPEPNRPPTAVADSYSVNEDQTLNTAAPGVLDNDTDPDTGDTRTAVIVSGPSHAASFTLNTNGSFSYTPTANYNGPDSFSYKARDAAGAESSAVTVSLTVNAVNDLPTITVAGGGVCVGDNGGRVNLVLADLDTPAANLTLGATSSNPQLIASITFAGAGAARTATITTSGTGSATITLNVSDGSSSGTTTVGVQAGGNGNNTLTGTEAADILLGQNGNDALIGSGGNDVLCAGRGNDTMTGASGADSFSGGQGTDAATDFTPAQGDTSDGTIP